MRASRIAQQKLHFAIVLGLTRTAGPPFPANLGARVGEFVAKAILNRGHSVDIINPIVEDLPLLQKPQFAYASGDSPAVLNSLAMRLTDAHGYVMITPEYNHSPSPALLNLLNHFGSSIFSFKPSAIVSYSAGQWGGTRAAHSLRPVLSELGCLPVSAMIHVPKAQEAFSAEGLVLHEKEAERWDSYAGRTLSQLKWWAEAAKEQRAHVNPYGESPPLRKTPAQRNAPNLV